VQGQKDNDSLTSFLLLTFDIVYVSPIINNSNIFSFTHLCHFWVGKLKSNISLIHFGSWMKRWNFVGSFWQPNEKVKSWAWRSDKNQHKRRACGGRCMGVWVGKVSSWLLVGLEKPIWKSDKASWRTKSLVSKIIVGLVVVVVGFVVGGLYIVVDLSLVMWSDFLVSVVWITKMGEKNFKFGNCIWLIDYGFLVYKFLNVMNLVMCSCMNKYMFVYMQVYYDKTKVSVTNNTCSKCVW